MVNQPGSQQGKLTNAVNSYCISILGDWPVCGSCHAGRGLKPGSGVTKANVDCLMCHSVEYANARARQPDGSMGVAVPTDSMVRNVAAPTRRACLQCHAKAGGGNGVKRGDLSISIPGVLDNATDNNTDANFDVHMNTTASDVQCQGCHVFINHKTIGKGSDLRPTDDLARGAEVHCVTCHTGMDSGTGHADAGANRTDADRHVAHVSCQACHVETYAKVPTEVYRDWRRDHNGDPAGTSGAGHPYSEKQANLVPELLFWDRTSDNYLLGDDAELTYDADKNTYPTSRPVGTINDKLYAFKYKTADQPIVRGGNCDGQLLALDTFEYIKVSGDATLAINSGLVNQGCNNVTSVDWITTDTYQMLNHGIDPAANVTCEKCHTDARNLDPTTTSRLDQVGYALKDDAALICAQCHREKNAKTNDSMHNHLNKGSGIDCLFCHTFTRPERNLCSPCDPACVTEFVDNTPYDHSADCP
jgi:nitrate reductase cytochrome c-type subunit